MQKWNGDRNKNISYKIFFRQELLSASACNVMESLNEMKDGGYFGTIKNWIDHTYLA